MPRFATDAELAVAALVAAELARHLGSPTTRARLRAAQPDVDPGVIGAVIDRYIAILNRKLTP